MSEVHDGGALLAAVYRYLGYCKPTPDDCQRPVFVTSVEGDYRGGNLWAVTVQGTPTRAALFVEGDLVYIMRPVTKRRRVLDWGTRGAGADLRALVLQMVKEARG